MVYKTIHFTRICKNIQKPSSVLEYNVRKALEKLKVRSGLPALAAEPEARSSQASGSWEKGGEKEQ